MHTLYGHLGSKYVNKLKKSRIKHILPSKISICIQVIEKVGILSSIYKL